MVKNDIRLDHYWRRNSRFILRLQTKKIWSCFFLVDRKKSLIKVNGLQVWPNEVEIVINSHPKVKECGIGGIPDKVHGERVVCWIVPEQENEMSIQEIIDWCKPKLAGYKIPSEVILIDKIPRTGVGKILRRTLISEYKGKKEV